MSAEEVKAEVIDSDVATLDGLDKWLAAASAKMSERAKGYMVFDVPDEEAHKRADSDLKAISRDLKEVKEQRMSMTRVIDDAKRRAMQAERDATKELTEIQAALKANDDAYKQSVIDRKRAELREAFEDAAPDLALPLEDGGKPLVDFGLMVERYGMGTLGKKWLLFGTNVEVAKSQLYDALTLIANDEEDLRNLVNPDDIDAVMAVYFATLDKSQALHEAANLKERRERLQRLEEERRAREEWMRQQDEPEDSRPETAQSTLPVLEHYVNSQAQPAPGDDVPDYVFFAYIPASKRDAFIAYCKQNDIHGNMRLTRGKRYELREA